MISTITTLWNLSPFFIIQEIVYEHQDTNKVPLLRLEKLNNKMDIMAKTIALEYIETETTQQLLPTPLGIGTNICGGELIISRVQHTLYTNILHDKLILWYADKHTILLNLLKTKVSLYKIHLARNDGRFVLNNFMTKWISGDTATDRVMLIRKKYFIKVVLDTRHMFYNVRQKTPVLCEWIICLNLEFDCDRLIRSLILNCFYSKVSDLGLI